MGGVSRSASIVIAYLMKYQNMTFRDALAYARVCRPRVSPNIGFCRQLKRYGLQLRAESETLQQVCLDCIFSTCFFYSILFFLTLFAFLLSFLSCFLFFSHLFGLYSILFFLSGFLSDF
jgi:hypothetical protein